MKRLLKRNDALYAENRDRSFLEPSVWEQKDEASVRTQLIDEICRMYPNRSFYYTLLSSGKGVNLVDLTVDRGNTLLHLCAKNNHADILQMLLLIPKMNEMIDAVNEDGETALGIALDKVSAESAIILIESEANLRIGKTPPLIAALRNDMPNIARLLIEKGCDIHAMESLKRTSLIWAIEKRMIDIAIELIARGVSLDDEDFNGDTALIKACTQTNCEQVITALIEFGADLHKPNKHGKLPANYAQSWVLKRHPELLNRKQELKTIFEESMKSLKKDMKNIWVNSINKE